MSSFTASKSALLNKGKPNPSTETRQRFNLLSTPSLTVEGKQQGKSDSTTVSPIEVDAREQGQDWQLTPT